MSAARGAEFKIRSEHTAFATMNIVADARVQNRAEAAVFSTHLKGTDTMSEDKSPIDCLNSLGQPSDDPPKTSSSQQEPASTSPPPESGNNADHEATRDENTNADRVRGRPFLPGKSGNPMGRPKGSLGWKARAAKELLAGDLEDIMKQAIATAKSGDPAMIKLCLLLAMHRQEDPVKVAVPKLDSPEACRDAIGCVVEETLAGELTPGDAKKAIELIDTRRASFTVPELEKEADANFEHALLIEFLAKYRPGHSKIEDLRNLDDFNLELCARNLPPQNHTAVFTGYMDFLLKHGKVASTADMLLDEIQDFIFDLQLLEKKRNELGVEGFREYARSLREPRKNVKPN